MAKGYWIGRGQLLEGQGPTMGRYGASNRDVLARYGARFIVRRGQQQVAEGAAPSGHTVVEFPSYEAALACYHDPEYQAVIPLRQQAMPGGDLVIIAGAEDA